MRLNTYRQLLLGAAILVYVTDVAGVNHEIGHLQAAAAGGRHLGIRDGGGRGVNHYSRLNTYR
jgi:hypothetical protein